MAAGSAGGLQEAILQQAGGDSDDLAPSQHEDENDGEPRVEGFENQLARLQGVNECITKREKKVLGEEARNRAKEKINKDK